MVQTTNQCLEIADKKIYGCPDIETGKTLCPVAKWQGHYIFYFKHAAVMVLAYSVCVFLQR